MGKVARKVPAPAGTGTAITWRALVLIFRYVKYKQRGST
jgi:hypothetical protein